MRQKYSYNILVFVPLAEEFAEVSNKFSLVEDFSDKFGCICYSATLQTDNSDVKAISFLLCQPSDWGNANSQLIVQEIANNFSIGAIVCIGIAGGISDDLKLCDVAVANIVFDICERQKITDQNTEFDTDAFSSSEKIVQRTAFLKSHPKLQMLWDSWQIRSVDNLDFCIKQANLLPEDSKSARELVRDGADFQVGAIASGPVGQSKKLKAAIKKIKRKILALETESGGLYRLGKLKNIPCLTIRGISDYSDGEKNGTKINIKEFFDARQFAMQLIFLYLILKKIISFAKKYYLVARNT